MKLLLTSESISGGLSAHNLAFAVEGRKIAGKGGAAEMKAANPGAEVIDLTRLTVLPGLIDIHVHGGNSFDTMDGNYEAVNGMSKYKINEGVTSFCPTTVTSSDEKTDAAIAAVCDAMERGLDGAKALSIFLEGPYINPKNKGAHPEEFIRSINLGEINTLVAKGKGKVKSFAIAPELPGAADAIKYLAGEGITVRIGHSSATLDQANAGAEAGASVAIHTYNAMSALNHREPGLAGAVMTNDNLYGEIICDLIHVHPKAVEVLVRAKGSERVIMITDCMRAGGVPDGEYYLGELPCVVKDGIARTADGALAGSTATLISCVKNMHKTVGVPLKDAVTMATANPAKALGLYDQIGSLDIGKAADIIAIDRDFNVGFVMVDGEVKRQA